MTAAAEVLARLRQRWLGRPSGGLARAPRQALGSFAAYAHFALVVREAFAGVMLCIEEHGTFTALRGGPPETARSAASAVWSSSSDTAASKPESARASSTQPWPPSVSPPWSYILPPSSGIGSGGRPPVAAATPAAPRLGHVGNGAIPNVVPVAAAAAPSPSVWEGYRQRPSSSPDGGTAEAGAARSIMYSYSVNPALVVPSGRRGGAKQKPAAVKLPSRGTWLSKARGRHHGGAGPGLGQGPTATPTAEAGLWITKGVPPIIAYEPGADPGR